MTKANSQLQSAPSGAKLSEQLQSAQRASVPLLAISTPDPAATIKQAVEALRKGMERGSDESGGHALAIEWDLLRGYQPIGGDKQKESFAAWVAAAEVDLGTLQFNPTVALAVATKLPPASVLFVHLAHRFFGDSPFLQAIWNLRDAFKSNHRMLVLLGAAITLPAEIAGDVVALDEPLPDRKQLATIVREQHEAAEIDKLPAGSLERAVDAVQGLPAFAAEQVVAMSLKKSGLDLPSLWERKRKQIEQTPGLKVYRGGERFEDIGGVAVVKEFVSRIMTSPHARPNAVVFVDEIEKMLAGAGGDTSGVTQDQLGALLSYMQDTAAVGMIFVGPPGSAKSMVAKAAGSCECRLNSSGGGKDANETNSGGVPTIQLDLGAAKGSLVGQSELQLRTALKVITAVASGKSLWIATCNAIKDLPPELRRRFTLGTFFFDLPTYAERQVIWRIWLAKFGFAEDSKLPPDKDWTGAEIRQCCEIAWRLDVSLQEASAFIVPVAKSAKEQLEKLREFAKARFLSASKPGVYMGPATEEATGSNQSAGNGRRKIALADDSKEAE